MGFAIRAYHPSDLSMLYRICLLTADSGVDGSHLYDDPDLPGHLFAAPHAVYAPDLCFVLTSDGAPCGYVLGVRSSLEFYDWCEREWLPVLRVRYLRPKPEDDSRQAGLMRTIHNGFDAGEDLDDFPAHLHIDLLPIAQGRGLGQQMMTTFLDRLRDVGVKGVQLGVGKRNQRAVHFYERVGFRMINGSDTAIDFGMRLLEQ